MLGIDFKKLVSSKPLGLFRILFGLAMLFQFFKISKRISFFKDPEYLYFPYPELDWMPVFSTNGMWMLFVAGLIATILFTIGVFHKYSAAIMTFVYGYFFSLDSMYYNNHYYLIFLIGFLMIFARADAAFTPLKSRKEDSASNWNYIIFQFQIAIVFFYGGLSKLNSDWINGNIISNITESELLNQVLNYGGLAFDLLIPFLLFSKKYRWYAIIAVILFNISNHFLFDDIASFPFLMIAAMLLFVAEGKMPDWVTKWTMRKENDVDHNQGFNGVLKYALIGFFAFQLIFPLRHHLVSDHVDWSGQGHYFSWRMKSYQKDIEATFYAHNLQTNTRLYPINHGLDNYTVQRTLGMPLRVVKFAKHLKNKIEKLDGKNPSIGISVDYKVAFNGRESRLAILPLYDVSEATFNKYGNNEWIIPLKNDK